MQLRKLTVAPLRLPMHRYRWHSCLRAPGLQRLLATSGLQECKCVHATRIQRTTSRHCRDSSTSRVAKEQMSPFHSQLFIFLCMFFHPENAHGLR
ncbi:hypothetical protein PC121_g20165 [Phytophthora cactorum]|uniref:Uncharacterized protein n=1 Tax=Phytophthora cactorum TaxID=29920 RepID=A0A8T1BJ01_9STRA|nr:hypothetical protein PC117_g21369 [Phytophthora cactorum]KAG3047269.1 hypothetical protein PC121_g20165 [Phytophthora cactorum]